MLIVIPESQPGFCGLADHAGVIAKAMQERGHGARICHRQEARSCAAGTALLLEYTPLAYSSIGLPWGLLLDVVRWRWRGCRVLTYFHELPFSNGRGWKRHLAVLAQRFHSVLLAAVSSAVLVNQASGLGWLGLLAGRHRLTFLPTCSNVGEAAQVPPPQARPLQVVVFGSPGKRRHAHALAAALGGYRQLFGQGVRVIDIGEHLALPEGLDHEVECLGPLPAAEVMRHLLESRYGFFYAEPEQFSKSGVFAAYCAAGVVPIIAIRTAHTSPYFLASSDLVVPPSSDTHLTVILSGCRRRKECFGVAACAHQLLKLCRPPEPPMPLPAGLPLLRCLPLPHKLGLLERLYGARLASRGHASVALANGYDWTLDLGEVTHRWLVYGDYEGPLQMGWLKRWLSRGGVFIDSGANIGQFTVSLASQPGLRTFAFEPVRSQRRWLEGCLTRYPAWDVAVIPLGLGDRDETAVIRLAGGRSTLRQDWYIGQRLEQEQIELTTLDQFVEREGIERIRLWKLDMEGFEPRALAGAQRLLAQRRIDALLIEAQTATIPTIAEYLALGGYGLYHLLGSAQLTPFIPSSWPGRFEGNLIALPPGSPLI